MDDTNNEQLIAWTKMIMIGAGVWNLPISKNWFIQNGYNAYAVFMKASYVVFWLLVTAELIRMSFFGNYPLSVLITNLSVVVNAIRIGSKVIIYLKNHLLEMFKDTIESEREVWKSDEEIKELYREKIRMCRIHVGSLFLATFSTLSFLIIQGAFSTVQIKHYNEANNATMESLYMYNMYYPKDSLKNLPLTFSTQAIWFWAVLTYNSFTQLSFATLLIYAASRLQILQVKLRNYIGFDFSEDPSEEQMKEKIGVLKSMIIEHKYIIGFIEDLNMRTRNIIMIEFILSSFNLASVSVSLIKMDFSTLGWQFSYFVLLGVQMYVQAWNCNEICIQSAAIADAVYESRWYLLNKEGRQLTQIMIARAQRPLEMTIGMFGPMTNQSAILIMKASYSYVSIMRE